MTDLREHIRDGILRVLAKPNARTTEVLGHDAARDAVRIAVAEAPENGKANLALLKFVGKALKKPVALVSGATAKLKVIRVLE